MKNAQLLTDLTAVYSMEYALFKPKKSKVTINKIKKLTTAMSKKIHVQNALLDRFRQMIRASVFMQILKWPKCKPNWRKRRKIN